MIRIRQTIHYSQKFSFVIIYGTIIVFLIVKVPTKIWKFCSIRKPFFNVVAAFF